MAGSIFWIQYTDDTGGRWAYNVDESNSKALLFIRPSNYGDIFTKATAPFPQRAPRGLKPRYVSCIRYGDSRVRRNFIIPNRTLFNRILTEPEIYIATDSSGELGSYWNILRCYNEQYPLRSNFDTDTGLDDGTYFNQA
jgi:hypothetical protein